MLYIQVLILNSLPHQTGALWNIQAAVQMAASMVIPGLMLLFSIVVYSWCLQFSSACRQCQRISYLSPLQNSECKTWQGEDNYSSVLIVKYMLLPASNKSLATLPINKPELSLSFMMIEEYSTDLEKQAEFSLLQTPHLS